MIVPMNTITADAKMIMGTSPLNPSSRWYLLLVRLLFSRAAVTVIVPPFFLLLSRSLSFSLLSSSFSLCSAQL